ncbi:MHYT domain-containing protein [Oceanobacter mangrovi]|uniref:MHYT domain-containing protein n=1 Tax=Oceanobacter mangrovi TaxID=2862510 RepID=UPI001C8E9EFD|nr:MHYT domain-containing protein [Oceanobacter mangrovi]
MSSEYNLGLVALSYLLSVFGSYTALKLATGIPGTSGRLFWFWLVGSAFALGGGAVWAMHFVGMLAYNTPLDFGYSLPMTLLSLVLAVFVVGLGLFVVGKRPGSLIHLVLAGTITGCGVAVMHYTGMAAMVMPGSMSYEPTLFLVSILIAVGAAICALWLAFNVDGFRLQLLSAMVMGVAVCGMHYTGMAAMHMNYGLPATLTLQDLQYEAAIDSDIMATLIAFVAAGVLVALLLGTREGLSQQRRLAALRIDR